MTPLHGLSQSSLTALLLPTAFPGINPHGSTGQHTWFEKGSRPGKPSDNKPLAFPPLAVWSAPSLFPTLCLLVSFSLSSLSLSVLSLFLRLSPFSVPVMVCLGHCLSLSLCLSGFPHLCDSHVCPAPAFMFRLDASTSHQNLRVDDLSVEWDAMGGKVQDIKAREKDGKGRTASPVNSPAR